MLKTAELGVSTVAPPAGLLSVMLTVFEPCCLRVVENRYGESLGGGIGAKCERAALGRVIGTETPFPSLVAYRTVSVPLSPPVRTTVKTAEPAVRGTSTVATLKWSWLANEVLFCKVSTALAGLPRVAPPAGLLRVRFTVSLPLLSPLFKIGTVKVWLVMPAPNMSVPLTLL